MPLIKCPDCGKSISSHADACPFCGCPSKYFSKEDIVQDKKTDQTAEQDERHKNSAADKSDPQTKDQSQGKTQQEQPLEDKRIIFNFAGYKFIYPAGSEEYANLFGIYDALGSAAQRDLEKAYDEAGTMEGVISKALPHAQEVINKIIDKVVQYLYSQKNIGISTESFINKCDYSLNYSDYITKIISECQKIDGYAADLSQQREIEKASRSRWQGGGFGLQGAVKGALQAGMLNAGSDLLHSFGDSARSGSDNAQIRNQYASLYKDSATRQEFCSPIYSLVHRIFDTLIQILIDHHAIAAVIKLSAQSSYDLYNNTKKYEHDQSKITANIIQCINYFPVADWYHMIPVAILYQTPNDFAAFLKFWNIESIWPNFENDRSFHVKTTEFFGKKGICDFTFNNYTVSNYLKIRNWVSEYYATFSVNDFPKYYPLGDTIHGYFNSYRSLGVMNSIDLFQWIPDDHDPIKFILYTLQDQKYLNLFSSNKVWIYGRQKNDSRYPSGKLQEAFGINNTNRLLIYYDCSFLGNGGKGFAFTEHQIIDLKQKNVYDINLIEAITLYKDHISITMKNELPPFSIIQDNNLDMSEISYLSSLLQMYQMRFAQNTPAPGISTTSEPVGQASTINGNNIENSEEMMYCSYCGKRIPKGSLFCTYCGASISPEIK